jgi:hypothetical protein
MSNELEQRLGAALTRARPTRDATVRARTAALATLPASRSRSLRWVAALAAAVVLAVVGLGAAALAATGKLHVVLGASHVRSAAPTRLTVPPRTHGIAVVAGGKLWLATRRGMRIEGMPVSAAELSPRALYAVVGLGNSLVALAPGGRHAWSHQTPGRVVAASWSPDGLKIAYVVRTRSRMQLRVIEGDGDHDRLLDGNVAAAKPVWRADSLAVTYFRPRHVVVEDFRRGTERVIGARSLRAAPARAASPNGDQVAVGVHMGAGALELRLVSRQTRRHMTVLFRVRGGARPVSISWR